MITVVSSRGAFAAVFTCCCSYGEAGIALMHPAIASPWGGRGLVGGQRPVVLPTETYASPRVLHIWLGWPRIFTWMPVAAARGRGRLDLELDLLGDGPTGSEPGSSCLQERFVIASDPVLQVVIRTRTESWWPGQPCMPPAAMQRFYCNSLQHADTCRASHNVATSNKGNIRGLI